jgi:hypothetical protein
MNEGNNVKESTKQTIKSIIVIKEPKNASRK